MTSEELKETDKKAKTLIAESKEKEEENTSENDNKLYSGVYPMDSLPRVKSYNNGEPIYYTEAEQEEILKDRVLKIMYKDHPEYEKIDPNELEIVFDHQASDADMGLDSETQLTHFKIKRKTEKKKEDVTPEQTPEVTSDVTPENTPEVTPETPSNLTPEPPSDVTPVGKSDPTPDKTSEKTPKKEPKAEPTKQEEPEEVANLYTVLGKLKEGIENKPKDFRRLQASKVTVAKDFVNDLRTKRVEYNVFGFVPAAGKALFRGISKYFAEIWSILDGGRVEGMMKKFQENWDKLTEEEKQILFDKYKGNEIQQLKLTGFNDALLPKLLEFGMAKIEKLNNNMKNNYAVLLETLKLIDELREKLAKGEVTKNEYNNAQEALLGQAARAIMYIMEDREKVNQLLSSGVHGIQEDFKAVRSKMIYAGYRWAKEQELSSEELLELGSYRGKLLDAIDKEKDPAIVVDNFMKMEGVLMDNTEIKKGILGERSVGKTYYMPIAEQFDYRGDPFIRNVIMTVTAVSSVVGMYNAYKTHKEIGQAEDRLREVDARNQAGAQNVRDTAQHQVDQKDEDLIELLMMAVAGISVVMMIPTFMNGIILLWKEQQGLLLKIKGDLMLEK